MAAGNGLQSKRSPSEAVTATTAQTGMAIGRTRKYLPAMTQTEEDVGSHAEAPDAQIVPLPTANEMRDGGQESRNAVMGAQWTPITEDVGQQ